MEGKIYQAISGVMSEIGAIGKNKKNQQQGFLYRGIDDIMNALQPVMVKHKVFAVPEILDQSREERRTAKGGLLLYSILRVRYRFYTEDGSYVEAVTIGEGMDSGDKASNKAMAIAFKYACFQIFCIPTEGIPDPDAESHEPQGNAIKRVTRPMINSLYKELERTGVGLKQLLSNYGVRQVEDMSVMAYKDAMDKLSGKPNKKPVALAEEGCPFD